MATKSTGYPQSIRYYMNRFNLPESTVFRWMQSNAPLDDDAALEAWVSAKPRKPAGFRIPKTDKHNREAEARARDTATARSAAGATKEADEEVGLRAEIGRLEVECKVLHDSYQLAKTQGLWVEAQVQQKLWMAAQGNLMKLRKETPKSEMDDAKSIAIFDVEAGLRRAFTAAKSRLEMCPRRMVMNMKGLTPGALEKRWSGEMADIIAELQLDFKNITSAKPDGPTDRSSSDRDPEAQDAA